MVEVSEKTYSISCTGGFLHATYIKNGCWKYAIDELPPGQWEIVLDTAEAEDIDYEPLFGQYSLGYFPDFTDHGNYYCFISEKECFKTFLRSLNLPTDRRYLILENIK